MKHLALVPAVDAEAGDEPVTHSDGAAPVSFGPGAVVGGYRIARPIATGGMAEVLLAQGPDGKLAAIKRLRPELSGRPELVRMFADETRLALLLNHPNVVRTRGVTRAGSDLLLVMEFLWGENVRSVLRVAARQDRDVPIGIALHVAQSVCTALHYAHELKDPRGRSLSLVHRDVSPHNIVLTYEGHVKLLDFGVAKSKQQELETRSGVVKGKLGYMSPEQCLGQPVDRRADVFAIGAVLYELTVGRKPFEGRGDFDVMRAIVDAPVTPPSALVPGYEPDLEAAVLRALERDRTRRFKDAAELQRALEAVSRRLNLVLSPADVRGFFRVFFAEKVAAWRRALDDGQTFLEFLTRSDEAFGSAAPAPDDSESVELLDEDDDDSEVSPGAPPPPRERSPHPTMAQAPAARRVGSASGTTPSSPRAVPRPDRAPPPHPAIQARAREVTSILPSVSGIVRGSSTVASLRAVVTSLPTMASVSAVARRKTERRGLLVKIVVAAHFFVIFGGGFFAGRSIRTASSPSAAVAVAAAPLLAPVEAPVDPAVVASPPPPSPSLPSPSPAAPRLAATGESDAAEEIPAEPPTSQHLGGRRRSRGIAFAVPRPTAKLGVLSIVTRPRCRITIDGKSAGYTPTALRLSPGPHVVLLTNGRYNLVLRRTVAVEAGRTLVKSFVLSHD